MHSAFMLVMMIPAYLVTRYRETRVLRRKRPDVPARSIRRECLFANSITYLLLASFIGWQLR